MGLVQVVLLLELVLLRSAETGGVKNSSGHAAVNSRTGWVSIAGVAERDLEISGPRAAWESFRLVRPQNL